MGYINAEAAGIHETWQNVVKAISDIEHTKSSMTRTFQQLGANWNDKKYQELGDVVQECKGALDKLLRILSQAKQPLSVLEKSLLAYEEIDLYGSSGAVDNSNSRASFVESLRNTGPVLKKSDKEKTQDLRTGIAIIDEILENYAESLESRGLQRGPVMDAILNQQRHLQQAELLRNINGDFSNPVYPLTDADFDAIIENCRSRGWLNYTGSAPAPRSLPATRYGFTTQTINGTQMRVYNDPVGTNSLLIREQGHSHYPMEGTCGLCQCANLLTLAGVQGANEDTVISAAMHGSDGVVDCMELFHSDTAERGGTTTTGRQEILSRCGLQTYSLPVSYDRSETTRSLSEAVRTGHGVIVSVDVAHLWRNGQRGGHAISLISVSEDGNTFIYNDTGSGTMGTISARDLAVALTGRPANITRNIIR